MRQWSLKSGNPLSLTLVSDARLVSGNYYDDQVWELALSGGEPAALALQTTYGLRAKSMRLFPRFAMGEVDRVDPETFYQSPVINFIFPNFIDLSFSPFPGIDVLVEYWVPQPQAIAARMKITNNNVTDKRLLVEWVGQLLPTEGQRMAILEMQAATILYGYSNGLAPVIFMTGGSKAGPGPYPSLSQKMELTPNDSRQLIAIHAALADREKSFELARSIATLKWDAERSRLEMLNGGQVEVYTGDTDWDVAFMLAQRNAISLLIGPTSNLPHTSFVLSRQPDQGFSLRGDGSDYNHLWNGQTPLDSDYLMDLILPTLPEVAQGLMRNFLAIQEEDGFIDWKPGLGGQRSQLLATPILANLAWHIYQATEQTSFLEEVFPGLLKFLSTWFTPEHDRDGDGIPEWDHPMQAGMDNHPIYSRWHDCLDPGISLGVDISTTESPSLCSYLYSECNVLIEIARLLGHDELIPELEKKAHTLQTAVEAAWDEDSVSYFDWDRDTHHSTEGELLMEGKGSVNLEIQRNFDQPVRMLIAIRTEETARRRPVLFVHGTGASGNPRVERITDEQIRWTPGLGKLTGKHVYASLHRIEVRGLEQDDRFTIQSVGFKHRDQSVLLPLWAGIPDSERAELLITETLKNPQRYWRAHGLPVCADSSTSEDSAACSSINLPWNSLIGKGLIRYGHREEAAELTSRLMGAIIQSLKREGTFHRYYHTDTGQGMGEHNALSGLAPLGLFLETLGVQIISPTRLSLSGNNPFPWPVTIKYRGLTVMRQKEKTTVIFPDGQTVAVDDPSPRMVLYQD